MKDLFLSVLRLQSAKDPQALEDGLHGLAQRENRILFSQSKDQPHRSAVQASDLLQVPSYFSQILLGEELKAHILMLAMDQFEQVLDENCKLERVRSTSKLILDLAEGADPDFVPVHKLLLELSVTLNGEVRRHCGVELMEDDEVQNLRGVLPPISAPVPSKMESLASNSLNFFCQLHGGKTLKIL